MLNLQRLATILVCAGPLAAPATAGWDAIDGGAAARPTQTNSNIVRLVLHCTDGPAFDIYASGSGVLQPLEGTVEADYFYRPGFILADLDGRQFPLVAAGSDEATVVYSEGSMAENYLAPLHPDLVEGLKNGQLLILRFDLSAADGDDGTAFETFANFHLEGSGALINDAIGDCQ